jgi:hypothetical protein
MDADTLIKVARDATGESEYSIYTPETAIVALWGHGLADDSVGDVDTLGHFIRVADWIVNTNSQGFVTVDRYPSESDAIGVMMDIAAEYYSTDDDDTFDDDDDDVDVDVCQRCGGYYSTPHPCYCSRCAKL